MDDGQVTVVQILSRADDFRNPSKSVDTIPIDVNPIALPGARRIVHDGYRSDVSPKSRACASCRRAGSTIRRG